MNEKQVFSVLANGISESEQIILKLIFTVSQRTRGRNHGFRLVEQDQSSADIVIIPAENFQVFNGRDSNEKESSTTAIVYMADNNSDITELSPNNILRRPLIATRTLSLLDDVVENEISKTVLESINASGLTGSKIEETDDESDTLNSESFQESGSESLSSEESLLKSLEEVEAVGLEETLLEEPLDEFEFSISEEEASELAIVADNCLSNPANNELIAELESNKQNELTEELTVENIEPDQTSQPVLTVLHSNIDVTENVVQEENISNIDELVPRVLVVDDSASVRKQLELELALFNSIVDYAGDACVANDLLQKNNYDVAFLDVVLPDGDGFEICKTVKANDKNTSVIMLTGKASPADKIKGTLAGCDAYLVKPVGRDVFQSTTKNYLTMLDPMNAMEA